MILMAVQESENGASEGIRTLDVHLGKVMLYQTELRSHPQKCRDKPCGQKPGKSSSFPWPKS